MKPGLVFIFNSMVRKNKGTPECVFQDIGLRIRDDYFEADLKPRGFLMTTDKAGVIFNSMVRKNKENPAMTTGKSEAIFNSMVRKNRGNPDFTHRDIGLRVHWILYFEAEVDGQSFTILSLWVSRN